MVEAVVEFDYVANEEDELSMNVGDVITNVIHVTDGWCEGSLNGKRGMFPDNFVKEVKKEKPSEAAQVAVKRKPAGAVADLSKRIGSVVIPTGGPPPAAVLGKKPSKKCKVLHEYVAQNGDELTLEVGQVIEILKQEEEGWWEGNLNGKTGMFPSNFVEVMEADESEKHEEVPAIKGRRVQGVGFGNIFGGGPIALRPTPGSQTPVVIDRKGPPTEAVKPPAPATAAVAPEPFRPKAKVATPTGPPTPAVVPAAAPAPAPAPVIETKPVVRAIVRYPYDAVNEDELSLAEGDIIVVLDQNLVDAGWWKGEYKGRVGVFPDNFVELLPPEEKPHRPPVPAAPVNGGKAAPVIDVGKAKKEDKEPLGRLNSIPTVDAPQPPMKKPVPKLPEARPTLETDDHKAKNKEAWRSDTLDRNVVSDKPLKPVTADRAKAPGRRPPTNNARDPASMDTEVKKEEKPAVPASLPMQPIKEEPVKKEKVLSPSYGKMPETPSVSAQANRPTGDTSLAELQSEVQKLRADLEALKRTHERRLTDLTTELDEETKKRVSLQVEIERLKKRLAD